MQLSMAWVLASVLALRNVSLHPRLHHGSVGNNTSKMAGSWIRFWLGQQVFLRPLVASPMPGSWPGCDVILRYLSTVQSGNASTLERTSRSSERSAPGSSSLISSGWSLVPGMSWSVGANLQTEKKNGTLNADLEYIETCNLRRSRQKFLSPLFMVLPGILTAIFHQVFHHPMGSN